MDSLHNYSDKLKDIYGLKGLPFVENIFGHRFRADQTPAILFFELFCIIENQAQAKQAGLIDKILSPEHDKLYFKHRQSFKLRLLIYQNELLETIHKSDSTDKEKWQRQFDYLSQIEGDLYQFNEDDINHIKSNFSSFDSYYNAINILSSLTFDPLSKKRWTSKFIYPISSEYIWCDFNNQQHTVDRRFFSRGGELIYLMLCRANQEQRNVLEQHFEEWLIGQNSSFSKLANLLVRKEERIQLEESKRIKLGFIPYQHLPIYDTLVEDFNNVLSLDLEKLDKIKVMIDLVGFNVGNYILAIGETYHNNSQPSALKRPYYLTEVLSKVTNSIRKTSIQSLSTQKNKIKRSLQQCKDEISPLYDEENEEENVKKERLKNELATAQSYLTKHILNYPTICFREIGLLSRKNTRSYRYVLSEEFLHSMVVIVLGNKKRIELTKFIAALRTRYSIYVDVSPSEEYELLARDLNRNAKNLATLLYQMGMLRHLSDACSYVINPYREDAV